MLLEILDRLKFLEINMSTKDSEKETRDAIQRVERDVSRIAPLVGQVLRRLPTNEVKQGPNYYFLPKQDVANIRALRGDDIKKFALDLEKAVYADQPSELLLALEERRDTSERVQFIRECVAKFYNINEKAERAVWETVRNSLNSRVRRNKALQRTTNVESAVMSFQTPERIVQNYNDLYDFDE